MKKIFKIIINVIVAIAYLVGVLVGILYSPFILIPLGMFAILQSILLFIKWQKKRRMKEQQIPQEILDDYNTAESEVNKYGGKIDPTTILWEIAKSKQRGIGSNEEGERGFEVQALHPKPIRSKDLSDYTYPRDAANQGSNSRPKGDNPKRKLFGRR